MSNEEPQPQLQPIFIFRILDHCGCLVCATYNNTILKNIEYYSACDKCRDNMPYEKYVDIYNMCIYELQLYDIKELVHRRGWITYKDVTAIIYHKTIQVNRENGRQLQQRMLEHAT